MPEVGEVRIKVTADTSEATEALYELANIWEPFPWWMGYATLLGVAFVVGWLIASMLA